MKKSIAYIDILGSKNSFLGDNPIHGIQKIEHLIQIIEDQLSQNPTLTACNFSDSFVLYGEEEKGRRQGSRQHRGGSHGTTRTMHPDLSYYRGI